MRLHIPAPKLLLQQLRLQAASLRRDVQPTCAAKPPKVAAQRATASPPPSAPVKARQPSEACSSEGIPPERLIGFQAIDVSARKGHEVIGVVANVLADDEAGEAQPLLQVCGSADSQAAAMEAGWREEHLIPYVPQIVTGVNLAAGLVYVHPPKGLLELGRQQRLLNKLREELEPFTRPKPRSMLQRMGIRVMPTAQQLLAAGKKDLVAAVKKAGGFLEVAQGLGLRSQRKPAGFWEDEVQLDEELTLFVAAHWTKFKAPDDPRQHYWFNQITHRISWEEPILPQRIEIDDEGGYILTEAEEDRVMPSRTSIQAAGRYDLHHAIMLHGGYAAAGELLDRRPAWPPSQHLSSLSSLREELREFIREMGLPHSQLPTVSQLADAGRGDLLQAILRRGGFIAAAEALGWQSQRRERQAWADAATVAAELWRYILETQFPAEARSLLELQQCVSASGNAAAMETVDSSAISLVQLPTGAKMPTHRQLAAAGRHDLKYALQLHGSAKVAGMLGIPHNRGRQRQQPSAKPKEEWPDPG